MDFVIVANSWAAGSKNPTSKHRIAIELARRGCRVLWLSGAGMRSPNLGSGSDRWRMLHRLISGLRPPTAAGGHCGIYHLSPLLLPFPSSRLARRFNGLLYAGLGRFWAGWLKLENPVLVNYVPTLGHAQKCWPWRKVYHCVDLWSAFGMYDAAVMEEMDSLCCREADVVVATSKDLYERCRKKNPNTHLVTHGVDHSHFAQALRAPGEAPEGRRQKSEDKSRKTETPIRNHESRIISSTPTPTLPADPSARARSSTEEASLAEKGDSPARLPRPADLPPGRIVGFFGLLSEWLDQELVVALAGSLKPGVGSQESEASTDRRIAATVVLIGQADVDISRFRSDPNVVLLGPKAFDELPSYVAHFDVGIIPFIVNELTVAVNPIKLREMLSAGCPVVSVDLPEVRAYAGARRVEVARGREAFLAAVRSLLANPLTQAECASLSASMASETWESKVDEMLRHIGAGSVGSD